MRTRPWADVEADGSPHAQPLAQPDSLTTLDVAADLSPVGPNLFGMLADLLGLQCRADGDERDIIGALTQPLVRRCSQEIADQKELGRRLRRVSARRAAVRYVGLMLLHVPDPFTIPPLKLLRVPDAPLSTDPGPAPGSATVNVWHDALPT